MIYRFIKLERFGKTINSTIVSRSCYGIKRQVNYTQTIIVAKRLAYLVCSNTSDVVPMKTYIFKGACVFDKFGQGCHTVL